MKITFILLFVLPVSLFCAPLVKALPWAELDVLIVSTESLSLKQKELKETLERYQVLHDAYLKDMDNRELLLKCAKLANQALETIKEEKLSILFDPGYLSEMTLFAKLASKPVLPRIE